MANAANKKLKFFVILSFICTINIFFMFDRKTRITEPDIELKAPVVVFRNVVETDHKLILYWNLDERDALGENMFSDCPTLSCTFTSKRTLPDDKYDAIIFDAPSYRKKFGLPKARTANQVYIFMSRVPYYDVKFHKVMNVNFYNWTMTYKIDSDIVFSHSQIAEKIRTDDYSGYNSYPSMFDLKKKTKIIALVSTDELGIRNKKYILNLSRYLTISKYDINLIQKLNTRERVFSELEATFHFVLIVQKYDCNDYVTEIMYNLLDYHVVPVLIGSSDYNETLPADSFVAAKNFKDHEALAMHLEKLAANHDEYVKYFAWRFNYSLSHSYTAIPCDVCNMLNMYKYEKHYENIQSWFFDKGCNK